MSNEECTDEKLSFAGELSSLDVVIGKLVLEIETLRNCLYLVSTPSLPDPHDEFVLATGHLPVPAANSLDGRTQDYPVSPLVCKIREYKAELSILHQDICNIIERLDI